MAEKIVKEMENWSDRVADSVLEYVEDDDATDGGVEGESQGLALAPEVPLTVKTGRLSLTEAEELANRASAFYVSPPLCRDLDRVIAKATTLERQVTPLVCSVIYTLKIHKYMPFNLLLCNHLNHCNFPSSEHSKYVPIL